jgi:hypothetical protein
MLERARRFITRLDGIDSNYQPVSTLRGCLYQAEGDVAQAAAAYKSAGVYFPLGAEYLRSAQGFQALGQFSEAWQEALISKFMQPYEPDIHNWMAERLRETGYIRESQIESSLAEALEGSASTAGDR